MVRHEYHCPFFLVREVLQIRMVGEGKDAWSLLMEGPQIRYILDPSV